MLLRSGRRIHTCGMSPLTAIYTVSLVLIFNALGIRYASCFFCIAGASPLAPLLLSWATENAAPDTVRAVVTAIIPG